LEKSRSEEERPAQAIFRQMQADADGQADSQPYRRDPLTEQ